MLAVQDFELQNLSQRFYCVVAETGAFRDADTDTRIYFLTGSYLS